MIRSTARIAALATLALSAAPAFANCPPLGTMPGFEKDSQTLHAFDRYAFREGTDDEGFTEKKVDGAFCQATYLHPGDSGTSSLDIQYNYRERLEALGATFTYAGGADTHGHVEIDGVRTWFHVYSEDHRIDMTVVAEVPHRASLTAPGADDHRLFGHMPGFAPDSPERKNFDEHAFRVFGEDGESVEEVGVQGAKYHARYHLAEGGQPVGPLDIHKNYWHVAKALGAELLYRDDALVTGRFLHEGQVVWMSVYAEDAMYEVTVVEEKPFAASLQLPEPNALRTALDADGRVAVHLNFDFAKSTLRPDAEPVIGQVLALLQADPALKLTIEGHTDDVGADADNLKLSKARAAAVVAALVAKGIEPSRLASAGFGEGKPVADNATSTGRAKNRRVELVRR